MISIIWKDIVSFWHWLINEAEQWYADGGQATIQEIATLAETAGVSFLEQNPTAIFTEFLPFVVNYVKANWKNDVVALEDSVVHFVTAGVAMKLGVPTTVNQGNLPGGTQIGG